MGYQSEPTGKGDAPRKFSAAQLRAVRAKLKRDRRENTKFLTYAEKTACEPSVIAAELTRIRYRARYHFQKIDETSLAYAHILHCIISIAHVLDDKTIPVNVKKQALDAFGQSLDSVQYKQPHKPLFEPDEVPEQWSISTELSQQNPEISTFLRQCQTFFSAVLHVQEKEQAVRKQ